MSESSADVADIRPEDRGPLTGRLLQERYRIKEIIGEGGMGAVYRAVHTLMDKEVAIKVLLPEFSTVEGLAKRFQQEAQSASRLEHPCIVQMFDFGQTEDGLLFLAMSYLPGRSLTDLIRKEAPLPPTRALPIALQICDALAHAHEKGVVHRDLKPDNVMLVTRESGAEQVKLLDFGIAKVTQGDSAAKGLTEAGMVFGTPEYLSPEQAAGDPVDARTDLYSLAVMLYEMLVGRKLFEAKTNVKYLTAHMLEQPRSMIEVAPELNLLPELDRIVLRALTKNPAGRYQTAAELGKALAAVGSALSMPSLSGLLSGVVPHAGLTVQDARRPSDPSLGAIPLAPIHTYPPVLSPTPTQELRRRQAVKWLLGACGFLVLLVAMLAFVLGGNEDEEKKRRAGEGGDKLPAAQLQRIQEQLTSGHLKEAEESLNAAVQKGPKDPRVHLLFGHLHCQRRSVDACLGSYQTATLLDAAVREDPALLENISGLLGKRKGHPWNRKTRVKAEAFVQRTFVGDGALGPRSKKMLTDYVNRWTEADLIWQVIGLLDKHKAVDKVDYVHAYTLHLRSEPDCDKRKKYLKLIALRKDKRFLPFLKRIFTQQFFHKPFSKKRVKNTCIRDDAARVIESLGGTVPESPQPKQEAKEGAIKSSLKGIVKKLKR
ncbi:MAG: serine/threonine-protein kinase [bacterium]